MKLIVYNLSGKKVWLTYRHDIYRDVIRIALHPKQPPKDPSVELYEDLINGQYLRLGRPEWSDATKVDFDISELDPQPKRYEEEQSDDDGIVRIFTFKLANGAS